MQKKWLDLLLIGRVIVAALALVWLASAREIVPGVVSWPVGACTVDLHERKAALVLVCPRHDLIRLWPWPIRDPWFEDGDPRDRVA